MSVTLQIQKTNERLPVGRQKGEGQYRSGAKETQRVIVELYEIMCVKQIIEGSEANMEGFLITI